MSPRTYLDHASTSPLRPEAAAAISDHLERGEFADPGRQYVEGRIARDAVERARESVARLLGARPREVVFTSGGTEAANAASAGVQRTRGPGRALCTAVEHSAVRLAAERDGPVELVRVDGDARIDLDHLAALLAAPPTPLVVHCQYANHEVGTLQPLEAVIDASHRAGVPVHVDACAAVGHVEFDFRSLGAELVSLSAHKLGGPPGVGALVVRGGTRLAPMLLGGEQERGRRAGMENVLGLVGFGAVAEALATPGAVAAAGGAAREHSTALRRAALAVAGVVAYGDDAARVPHIVCLGVTDVEAEAVVLGLDQAGVAVHSGSACASESLEPSPVLLAMGVDAQRSLRISVGWSTRDEDVVAFARTFPAVIAHLRALRDHAVGAVADGAG